MVVLEAAIHGPSPVRLLLSLSLLLLLFLRATVPFTMNLCASFFALALVSLEPFVDYTPTNTTRLVDAGKWVAPLPSDCRPTGDVDLHQQWLWFYKCSPLDTWQFAVQNWPRCTAPEAPDPAPPTNGSAPATDHGGATATVYRMLLFSNLPALFVPPPLLIAGCVSFFSRHPHLCRRIGMRAREGLHRRQGYAGIEAAILDGRTSPVHPPYSEL